MEFSYMLNQMCHEVLSNADVNAICKARGFIKTETDNRSQFESFYLTSIGLEAALRTLSPAEIACLHLLDSKTEEVDLTFFERIYGSEKRDNRYYYGTFTQQYQETFKAVKQNLLRRGLLVMAELRTRSDNTKMERWRFRFPHEFAHYLPPLIPKPHTFELPGDDRSTQVQRDKVLEALDTSPAEHSRQNRFQSVVAGGDFSLGGQPFSLKRLREWQQSAWQSVLSVTMPDDGDQSLPPADALRTILGTLASDEWADIEQLAAVYEVFCFGVRAPSLREICELGWKQGNLARYSSGNQRYYRLPGTPMSEVDSITPQEYLHPLNRRGAAQVDLHTIPFVDLEVLNLLAYLEVEKNQLLATPSQVKLGRVSPQIRASALGSWLSSQIPAFGETFKRIAKNWGKTILHTQLFIAQVRDLSLRVQLERALGENILLLSDEFVAFPQEARADVEKIVQKEGFVIKTVKAP